jgi:hypothetical protein
MVTLVAERDRRIELLATTPDGCVTTERLAPRLDVADVDACTGGRLDVAGDGGIEATGPFVLLGPR